MVEEANMIAAARDPKAFAPQERKLFDWLANPWNRLNNLYWIENEHGQRVLFKMTNIQKRFYREVHWRNVVLKARQTRLSTLCLILALDHMLFHENQTCGAIDITDEDAKRKLMRLKFAYDHLGEHENPGIAEIGRMLKKAYPVVLSNAHEFMLSNGSKMWASTSMRGSAINFLWITELGKTSVNFPDKAREIVAGAFNTVHRGNTIIIESTFEGGRSGKFYDLIRLAQKSPLRPNDMQFKFHFFPWHEEPTYVIPVDRRLGFTESQVSYFAEIEKLYAKKLTDEQKAWWVFKQQTQGSDMALEFPGLPEESLQAMSEGSIYRDAMTLVRAKGRVCDLSVRREMPMFVSWDIGRSDYTVAWLIQMVQWDILVLDCYAANGKGPAEHAVKMAEWERTYNKPIVRHYVPHDAGRAGHEPGRTWKTMMEEAGMKGVRVVPITPDVWQGIGHLRGLMERMWFNSATCDEEGTDKDGNTIPSGLASIEGYHKKVVLVGGRISEDPVHDEYSHAADALRTFAEAHLRGMLEGESGIARESRAQSDDGEKLQVLHGLRGRGGLARAK